MIYTSVMVELGGGTHRHPRADISIDLHHPWPQSDTTWDITRTPWKVPSPLRPEDHWLTEGDGFPVPLASGSVDEVYASHVLEHVPAGQPLIDVMNEAWRVLRSRGTFTFVVPLVGYTIPGQASTLVARPEAWADPTHVNHWWLPERLSYFLMGENPAAADYGIREWLPGCHYVTEEDVSRVMTMYEEAPPTRPRPFWSVRGGWEGVVRLVKP